MKTFVATGNKKHGFSCMYGLLWTMLLHLAAKTWSCSILDFVWYKILYTIHFTVWNNFLSIWIHLFFLMFWIVSDFLCDYYLWGVFHQFWLEMTYGLKWGWVNLWNIKLVTKLKFLHFKRRWWFYKTSSLIVIVSLSCYIKFSNFAMEHNATSSRVQGPCKFKDEMDG